MKRGAPMKRGKPLKRTGFKRPPAPAGMLAWHDESASIDVEAFRRIKPIASVHSLANPMRARMSRPPALVFVMPKAAPCRSEAYRRWVATLPCVHCGLEGWSNACHGDRDKGMALKACDSTVWPGCVDRPGLQGCHSLFGATGRMGREARRVLEAEYAARTRHFARQVGAYPAGWPE